MTTETKANFNVTAWASEFWSFTEENSNKQGEPLPITDDQRIGFCMADALGEVPPVQGDFGYSIAEKRAAFCGLKCTPGFLVCIASMADSPGEIVMLIHAFRYLQEVKPKTYSSWDDCGYNAAAFFYITKHVTASKDHLHKCWDAQKGGPGQSVDNWLDVIAPDQKFVQAIRNGYVDMEN